MSYLAKAVQAQRHDDHGYLFRAILKSEMRDSTQRWELLPDTVATPYYGMGQGYLRYFPMRREGLALGATQTDAMWRLHTYEGERNHLVRRSILSGDSGYCLPYQKLPVY